MNVLSMVLNFYYNMNNILCDICKELIEDDTQSKKIFVNCQELRCHKKCIRKGSTTETKYIRERFIKIRNK